MVAETPAGAAERLLYPMVLSMTGFGRAIHEADNLRLKVEMRGVNHRYGDLQIRLPKGIWGLEERIRRLVQQRVHRGRVEIFVSLEDYREKERTVRVNQGLLQGYWQALTHVQQALSLPDAPTLSMMSQLPDLFSVEEEQVNEEEVWTVLASCVTQALEGLVGMREAEGIALQRDILYRCTAIEQVKERIAQRSPQAVAEAGHKLEERVAVLLAQTGVDPSRIAMEAAILADKADVSEETVRIGSHLYQVRSILHEGGPVGRKLDFLVQELHREFSTIGSKVADAAIAGWVVEAKAEVEKVREQVQNIE